MTRLRILEQKPTIWGLQGWAVVGADYPKVVCASGYTSVPIEQTNQLKPSIQLLSRKDWSTLGTLTIAQTCMRYDCQTCMRQLKYQSRCTKMIEA